MAPAAEPADQTLYEYDPAGRVVTVNAGGELPTMFDYGSLPGDGNAGRLHRVRRAALQQGSTDVTDGELATRVVYGVPLSQAAGGPHNMDWATIQTWAQNDLPTDATAIFGPEDDPLVVVATATTPGAGGYGYATLHYLNASGQKINTATPGGHVDTVEYDKFGNVVRSLQATERELALGIAPNAAATIADLQLPADTAERARLLSTTNTYSADGIDLLDTLGPQSRVVLEAALVDPNGMLATIPAGATVIGRPHPVNSYDEGKPDTAVHHLLTTARAGLSVPGYPDADVRIMTQGYDPINGSVSGWTLKAATKVVGDTGAGGLALTAYVVYDAKGRAVKSWGIGSDGTDAKARESIFYTAGANPADGACGNRPEWAGQPCVTRAAGAITGHDPTRMAGDLPVRRVLSYTRFGEPDQVTETVPGTPAQRTTITGYDGADRIVSVTVTTTDGQAVPAVTTGYDPTTGDVTTTTMGTATITREYDRLGRLARYTDADGAATVNEFDRFGKPTKVSDPTGWATFAYDRSAEPRGFLTSVTDSVAGTFGAGYSPDGQLTTMRYPGGLTRTDTLDANLTPVARAYTRDSDGQVVYAEQVVTNSHGQTVNHSYTGGSKVYGYDRVGRLTRTAHTVASQCVVGTYSHDARSNRTSRRTFNPAGDGSCDESGDPEAAHGYDTAGRIVDAGYGYDPFGRTAAMPGGQVNAFYANDLVASQTLGVTRQSWTLDPAHRFRSVSTETLVDGAWVNATSKLNHYGDDSDEVRWIVEDTTLGSITRNVSGPDGDLAAATTATGDVRLQLTSLHGSVVATIDTALTAPAFFDYDEFGIPTAGQADLRYGWLGGKQRSGDALGDAILMGVRLYSPNLGRFLQPDPVDGGSATAYDYCFADPINCTDLDGRWGFKPILSTIAVVASVAAVIPGPIGMVASAVSAVSYAATGNWKQAAIMTAGIALSAVGAGAAVLAVRAAVVSVRAARATGAVVKLANGVKSAQITSKVLPHIVKASRFGERLFNSRRFGGASRLFGDVHSGARTKGLLNRGKRLAFGWSADSLKKALPRVNVTKSTNAARTVFRMNLGGRHFPLFYGPWRSGGLW